MSGSMRMFRREQDGTFRAAIIGTDDGANQDNVRTDPNRIIWTRPYEGYVQVDPVLVPAAEGVLWNPGATAAELYEVRFLVVNVDAGNLPVTVGIGVEVGGAGGALTDDEWWMQDEVIAHPGTSGWRGPFIIAGDDDIRGVASVADDATVHWRIRRCDVGA